MYSDIKQVSGCLEIEVVAGKSMRKVSKVPQETFGSEGYIYLDCGDSLIGVYTYAETYQSLHFICSLLYVNFT